MLILTTSASSHSVLNHTVSFLGRMFHSIVHRLMWHPQLDPDDATETYYGPKSGIANNIISCSKVMIVADKTTKSPRVQKGFWFVELQFLKKISIVRAAQSWVSTLSWSENLNKRGFFKKESRHRLAVSRLRVRKVSEELAEMLPQFREKVSAGPGKIAALPSQGKIQDVPAEFPPSQEKVGAKLVIVRLNKR